MTSWFAPRPHCASPYALRGLLPLALFALFAAPAGAQGNNPAALITKMEDLYKNAKSFQGTITTRQSGKTRDGKTFAVSGTREVRFKAPNEFHDDQRYTGTGAAAKISGQSVLYVGDGKSLYVYQADAAQGIRSAALRSTTVISLTADCGTLHD